MEIRRKDRKRTEMEAKTLLENTEYGVLSTIGGDGMPYGVPISFAYVDDCLYMHGSRARGHKMMNIEFCAKASFTVVDHVELQPELFSTKYMSAIAFGTVEIVSDVEEKRKGLEAIIRKYSPAYWDKGMQYIDSAFEETDILKFKIESLSCKGKMR